jgi:ankyrin repeat protein
MCLVAIRSVALFVLLFFLQQHPTFLVAADAEDDLFDAVTNDSAKDVHMALRAGADINAIGRGGQTALMFATLGGKTSALVALLDKGADVTIGEADGYTPMHGAGFQGRADIAKILIDHGLDASDRHRDGFTPFHRACWGREDRHVETARVFLEHGGVAVDEASDDGKTCKEMTTNQATLEMIELWEDAQQQQQEL